MRRRRLVGGLATLSALSVLAIHRAGGGAPSRLRDIEDLQGRWREFVPDGADVAMNPAPLERSPVEWREALPADAFAVLFAEDTEPPFSSALNDEKRAGVFVCRACALPLFTSLMKYDSGTGWPSFFASIPGHLATRTDLRLIWPRTEYHCVKCGGHQGHVFDDGPEPTGQRWCNNGLALRFIPLQ